MSLSPEFDPQAIQEADIRKDTGTRLLDLHSNSGRVSARFGFGKKKTAPKKSSKTFTSDRSLWYPDAKAPEYLDGSLVGDYGFDPFGLGKPAEYLQFDLDSLDQNLAGDVIGSSELGLRLWM